MKIKLVFVVLTILILMPACASQKESTDPEIARQKIAEARATELELVRTSVVDTERADRFIKLLGERDKYYEDRLKAINAHRERVLKLNADYHARRSDMQALLDDYNNQRMMAQQDLIALVEAMKKETTADEWRVLAKYQVKNFDARALTYGRMERGN
jgi:hypothetical protein